MVGLRKRAEAISYDDKIVFHLWISVRFVNNARENKLHFKFVHILRKNLFFDGHLVD